MKHREGTATSADRAVPARHSLLTRILPMAGIVAAAAAAALSQSASWVIGPDQSCFRQIGTKSCCATYSISCNKDDNVWTCQQTSNSGGYSVAVVAKGNPGSIRTIQTFAGKCKMKTRTCGSTPNSCIEGPEQSVSCYNEQPSGPAC
ncbi:MAG: hypothetical protein KF787_12355 [Phycisphaeraceae bacterium]|nr:hypothetical protein [Phycisphaerae bacterium]MBX3393428.1 hypothetical protein [Phycisphaeraceae bacterium]HRJ48987.1 hypothetical protein [Phycisphaerales bacterium]